MQVLFAATIFLSSFLLFLIQPLIAKQILPWFGGAAAVWTTCLLFFQALLLGGYVYAHTAVRYLKPRTHAFLHTLLLVASIAALPALVDPSWKPEGSEQPVWQILAMLGATIGLPYFMLSSTGPLVQVWYARALQRSPYRLFALSNVGSLAALLAYPIAVEPWFATRSQALGWSAAAALFVVLSIAAAFAGSFVRRAQRIAPDGNDPTASDNTPPAHKAAPRPLDYARWVFLPALASYMLLAVSNHIVQNIASIPFLWIAPLALYLASFILCFEGDNWYRRGPYLALLAVGLVAMAWFLDSLDLKYAVPVYLAGLFLICMFCHGEVAAARPAVRHLTGFYLAVSLGGVTGALLVAVAAPLLLPGYFELGFGLLACAAFALAPGNRLAWWARLAFAPVLIAVAVLVVQQIRDYVAHATVAVRDFYGAYRVISSDSTEGTLHELRHGRILHGAQFVEPPQKRGLPLTYYSISSGVGIVVNALRPNAPRRIGMVGLGAGTLAAYGKPGDTIRFYEIDPLIAGIAKSEFYYLKQSSAKIEIALGDARLSLEREPPQRFDLLAVDAFSGDAIPVHLLSVEAIDLYLHHLKPDGVLMFHVTNRYLDLGPVVARIAQDRQLHVALISHEPSTEDDALQYASSDWVLISRDERIFRNAKVAAAAKPLAAREDTPLWTDDFNNLLRVLR